MLVADLCMFGLAACDEEGPGIVNASVRAVTNARQVGLRLQIKCTGMHRHARVGANNASGKMERSGAWVQEVARAIEEQAREDEQELKMWEQKKGATDAKMIRGIVHEDDKIEGSNSHAR